MFCLLPFIETILNRIGLNNITQSNEIKLNTILLNRMWNELLNACAIVCVLPSLQRPLIHKMEYATMTSKIQRDLDIPLKYKIIT